MKKIIFAVFMVIAAALFSGCATKNVTYVKATVEDTSILKVPENLTVVSFNDNRVRWKTSIWYFPIVNYKKFVAVKIPAGESTLVVDYNWRSDTGTHVHTRTAKGIVVTHDFQPGSTYELIPLIFGDRITIMVRKQ